MVFFSSPTHCLFMDTVSIQTIREIFPWEFLPPSLRFFFALNSQEYIFRHSSYWLTKPHCTNFSPKLFQMWIKIRLAQMHNKNYTLRKGETNTEQAKINKKREIQCHVLSVFCYLFYFCVWNVWILNICIDINFNVLYYSMYSRSKRVAFAMKGKSLHK